MIGCDKSCCALQVWACELGGHSVQQQKVLAASEAVDPGAPESASLSDSPLQIQIFKASAMAALGAPSP